MSAMLATLAAALIAGGSAPPDLNAPIDTKPTLASEMRRGWLAADDCSITLPPLDLAICVGDRVQAEQKVNGYADPFALGAFLHEWAQQDMKLQSDSGLHLNPLAQAAVPEDEEQCAGAALVVIGLQQKLGLTDAQLFAPQQFEDASGILARWAYWRARPLRKLAFPDQPQQ